MPNAIGYVRVSTVEQAESALSIEAQRRQIALSTEARGWTLGRIWIDEGVSGGQERREGLDGALDALGRGDAEILVVTRLDRLTRSVGQFVRLVETAQEETWDLVALDLGVDTTTPAGRMLATIIAAFAQYERDLISERTKEALAAKRARGERLGGAPEIPPEIAARIVRERASGQSLEGIAQALTRDGIPTARAGTWRRSTVLRVLRREGFDPAT